MAMLDADPDTAWRMDGDGTGQEVSLTFPRLETVAAVALDPGFDKTSLGQGEDRWPENRRISAATFTMDGGAAYSVSFSTAASLSPSQRLQTYTLPAPVTTTRVVLHIDATKSAGPGHVDSTAISRLAVLTP